MRKPEMKRKNNKKKFRSTSIEAQAFGSDVQWVTELGYYTGMDN